MKKIYFKEIKVETMENNSGIFIGKNNANWWDANSKTQELIGSIKGDYNNFCNDYGVIVDKDIIDVPISSDC